eukprot:TRINITY_DN13578_c0_g1_i4.p1 TRINITY_DN13578_c0_g1~~TRINITY_DN13578_c0_g1_i4.p1  ORF type:complete len:129 (+),score=17.88 TRINITY_DN13578_c0_g1_i4:45-431(+)
MMREPKTEPIPAPEPATPTVAAPAPMNLAAESMSVLAAEVDSRAWLETAGLTDLAAVKAMRGQTVRRVIADILLIVRFEEVYAENLSSFGVGRRLGHCYTAVRADSYFDFLHIPLQTSHLTECLLSLA